MPNDVADLTSKSVFDPFVVSYIDNPCYQVLLQRFVSTLDDFMLRALYLSLNHTQSWYMFDIFLHVLFMLHEKIHTRCYPKMICLPVLLLHTGLLRKCQAVDLQGTNQLLVTSFQLTPFDYPSMSVGKHGTFTWNHCIIFL